MKTVKDINKWLVEYRDDCMESYRTSKDVPDFLRSPKLEVVWCTGCWLNVVLGEMGATKQQIHEIGFAHGQRCLFQDPFRVAV